MLINLEKMFSNIQNKVAKFSPPRELNIILVGYSKLNFVDSLKFSSTKSRMKKFGFVDGKCKDGTNNPTGQINASFNEMRKISKEHVLALNKSGSKSKIHFINNFDIFGTNMNQHTDFKHMLYSYFKVDGIYRKDIFIDSIHLGKRAQHKVAEKIMEYIHKNKMLKK